MAQQKPIINIQDIELTVRTIDIAAKRGTFEGPELETIGGLRNRFATILQQSAEDAKTEAEKAESETSKAETIAQ